MIHHTTHDGHLSTGRALARGGARRARATVGRCGAAWLALMLGAAGAAAQPTAPTEASKAAAAQPAAPAAQPGARPEPAFGANQPRLMLLGQPPTVGATPKPSPAVKAEFGRFVQQVVSPQATLDVVVGRTHLIVLKSVPKRVQISDDTIAAYTLVTPTNISILGKDVGTTVLTFWFTDPTDKTKERILSYLVRVLPDPELKERLERVIKALEDEVARAFPDSRVKLALVGDKVIVTGEAKDVADVNHIIEIVQANVPGGRATAAEQLARIPVDRANAGYGPNEVGPPGLAPVGITNYPVSLGLRVINLLRVAGDQQVSLHVVVAEVNRAAARAIGVNFNIFNNNGVLVFGQNTGNILPLTAPLGTFAIGGGTRVTGSQLGAFNNLPAALDNGQFQLAISALRELNYARTLAEPNLTTLNGQTATFQHGGLFPVPVVTGFVNSALGGVTFIPVGVQLSFTPFITDRDRIRLNVSAEVSERDPTIGSTIISGAAVPNLVTRNFQSTVELREGQTLAVAGLIQNRLNGAASRVPFFGDLPILGRLASFERVVSEETEMVILITPQIVHPMRCDQVPPLPGVDIFEPGDLEFYLCGNIESNKRALDFRSSVMTDLCKIRRWQKCNQAFITGPCGSSLPPSLFVPTCPQVPYQHEEPQARPAPVLEQAPVPEPPVSRLMRPSRPNALYVNGPAGMNPIPYASAPGVSMAGPGGANATLTPAGPPAVLPGQLR